MSKRPGKGPGNVPPIFTHHVVNSAGVPSEPHLQINLHFHINPQTGTVSTEYPPPNGQPPDEPSGWHATRPNPVEPATGTGPPPELHPEPEPETESESELSSEDENEHGRRLGYDYDNDFYGADSSDKAALGFKNGADPGQSYRTGNAQADQTTPGYTYDNFDPQGNHDAFLYVIEPPDYRHTELRHPKQKTFEKTRRSRTTHERTDLTRIIYHPITGNPVAKRTGGSGGFAYVKPKMRSRLGSRTKDKESHARTRYFDTRKDEGDTRDRLWFV